MSVMLRAEWFNVQFVGVFDFFIVVIYVQLTNNIQQHLYLFAPCWVIDGPPLA